ncbi:YvrJ family protein [uncultured Anaerococcus sp.]|nr:YvrJ family protein [uncultured Anaerococcus sp.]
MLSFAEINMDIFKLISELGFPIVMNIILIVQINGKLDRIIEEIQKS